MSRKLDKTTKDWIRNASDEKAVANGCHFDEARGQFVVDWIERYLRLYEGDFADQPFKLMPWQYEVTMRMFGWVKWSDVWKRYIRRFTKVSIFICKKNGKSPLLAAWGLYLAFGDGEAGGKVFFGAKDGSQVREIAGKHAIEMCKSSPELMAECEINNTLMQITHNPTRSILKPISSGDSRSQKAREGLNGSLLIDECVSIETTIDTPLGPRAISDIVCGDEVFHALGVGTVMATTRRQVREAYHVTFSDETRLVITGNHPLFTEAGWESAKTLEVGAHIFGQEEVCLLRKAIQPARGRVGKAVEQTDRLFSGLRQQGEIRPAMVGALAIRKKEVCALWRGVQAKSPSSRNWFYSRRSRVILGTETILFGAVQLRKRWVLGRASQDSQKELRGLRQEVCTTDLRSKERRAERKVNPTRRASLGRADFLLALLRSETEAATHTRSSRQDQQGHAGQEMQAAASRGNWSWSDGPSNCATEDIRCALGGRADNSDAHSNGQRLPDVLQTRYCAPGANDRNRSGWQEPHGDQSASTGRQEGRLPAQPWVVSVSHVEYASPITVCNLHVSGHPSYFANGKLVHNCHVVDRAFMTRVSRMGVCASEPMQIEVSTAGNDPESYGKSEYDYGKKVESGEEEDQAFFFCCHEAPQTISEPEIELDPVKYGKMGNPAWGITVHEEEFLADYNRSKGDPREMANFMMYRLNKWQYGSNPAILRHLWDACAAKFDLEEFAGRECYGGLDLGYTHDMSALALWFPWDEIEGEPTYRLLMKLWLPEKVVRDERLNVEWNKWAKQNAMEVTDGNSADFPRIRQYIADCAEKYSLQELTYDPRFAATIAQDLMYEHYINCTEFLQSAGNYAEPCAMFKSLILDKRVQHEGNDCLSWQVGHVVYKERGGNLISPCKPEENSFARIDGVVASLMGLGAAIKSTGNPPVGAFY